MTREAEWSDDEREEMLALALYQRGVGPCGFHHSLTADPANAFTTNTETCTVCAGVDQAMRVQAERDRKAEAALKDRPSEPRPSDGRQTFIRQLRVDEIEERRSVRDVGRLGRVQDLNRGNQRDQ